MALYTGKGDTGTTKTFSSNERISKHASVIEALGALDELNSFIGYTKVKAAASGEVADSKNERSFAAVLHEVQDHLFTVQAELAGADKQVAAEAVTETGNLINRVEKEMPAITTFFVPGGTELAAMCDVARTQARRAERRVIAAIDEGAAELDESAMAYMNRLSSLLYALARLANHRAGYEEEPPHYD